MVQEVTPGIVEEPHAEDARRVLTVRGQTEEPGIRRACADVLNLPQEEPVHRVGALVAPVQVTGIARRGRAHSRRPLRIAAHPRERPLADDLLGDQRDPGGRFRRHLGGEAGVRRVTQPGIRGDLAGEFRHRRRGDGHVLEVIRCVAGDLGPGSLAVRAVADEKVADLEVDAPDLEVVKEPAAAILEPLDVLWLRGTQSIVRRAVGVHRAQFGMRA